MVTKLIVRWDKYAFFQLQSIADYLHVISPEASTKVVANILKATKSISTKPRMHPADSLRLDQDTNYRAFIIYHYRITYFIAKDHIRIIRIRHTSREPLHY
ncbi:MAG: type II toxin-antitoxin system RelE/ParE family toxin [Bacteroidia bacterium]